MSPAQERRVLAALLFGNFVTGTGILLPAGMLGDLAHGFDVSLPRAGLLLLVSGVVVALGAPLAAAFTSAVDRRWLLSASMLLYAVCHMASALAPNFAVLLAVRIVLAIPAAIFTPQAAATVGALLPAKRRGSAITVIFIGWSLATVGGMPLGGYVAHTLGWQVAFLIVAALSIVALLGVWLTVPRGVKIAPLNVASWRRVLTSQALMTVLLVTVLNGTGQFTFFTYLAPSLKASLSDNAELLKILLEEEGHETFMAHDGVEGLAAAERLRPDVVLMDLGLPRIDGFDACRRIREQAWGKQILMIAITGWGQDVDRRKSQEAGFDHHLVKPVEASDISALMSGQTAVEQHR